MAAYNLCLDTVDDFLAQKRIAFVGISRDPADFSVTLFKDFCHRGYDMVPVNPNAGELFGHRCFARMQDIQPPVDTALLMTSPAVTEAVVSDCADAGVRRVWMYRAAGEGAVSSKAVEFCRTHGIQVVPGECPYMFWRDAHVGHRIHGFIRKITGHYPRRAKAIAA